MKGDPYPSRARSLTPWIKAIGFNEVSEKYRDIAVLKRANGIVECRFHTDGGPCQFGVEWHHGIPMLWRDLGADMQNEVLIITGTGDSWMGIDIEGYSEFDFNRDAYDHYLHDATKLVEGFLHNIDIPTIAAVNGGGFHLELALLADIVICSDNAVFDDIHFAYDAVPGDGLFFALVERIGITRAAHLSYLDDKLDAAKALDWGLVSETMPLDKLLGRAWEIAGIIMKRPRTVRRFSHSLTKRYWKQVMQDHLANGLAHEILAMALHPETSSPNEDHPTAHRE